MKTKSKIITGIAIAIISTMMATVMVAQQPGQPPRANKINREQVPPSPPNAPTAPVQTETDVPDLPFRPHLNIPDLTIEQQDKIRQADLDHLKAMTPLKNQIREKKARLQTILTTTPFDGKAADQVAEELGKTKTDILKAMIRHDQALRNILTPQQQIIFDTHPKPYLKGKNKNPR